jgi:hypothetical protein
LRQEVPRLALALLGAAASAFLPSCVHAQPGSLDAAVFWNAHWENDVFSGRGTDRHYTNGLRISHLRAADQVPRWVLQLARALPWFPHGVRVRGAWSLGQNLYTPEDIQSTELIPDDRPYAGWLYLGTGLALENGKVLDLLELSLGIVGPAAGGEELQNWIHGIIDSPEPKGWHNQLPNEPTVQLIWQRKWRQLHEGSTGGLQVDLLPHVGAALGNVFIYGAGGAMARLGFDLPGDYGPPRIQPSLPGSEFFLPRRNLGGYLFLGAEGRAILRNLFLDGSTFEESHSVQRKPLVADVQAGVALVFRGFRLTYTYVVRTREFTGQSGGDTFGAFTLSVRI